MRNIGFPPVLGTCPDLLILGSFPSQRSLAMGQYYAHPRNVFWRILGMICGFSPDLPYETRLSRLKESGIALWDCIQACERAGSLDTQILPGSEVYNDLAGLLDIHPTIQTLAFNGAKSFEAFNRYTQICELSSRLEPLRLLQLPSTSPANARLSFAQKLEAWSIILPDHAPALGVNKS